MKLILSIIALVIGGVAAWWYFSPPEELVNNDGVEGEQKEIALFYYNPSRDQGPGGAQCSAQGLVAVERQVDADADTEDVIELLLEGELTASERASGIETELPLEGVRLITAEEEGDTVTLTFADPNNQTSGGACRAGILAAQVEATAKAFTGATEVRLLPAEAFQP